MRVIVALCLLLSCSYVLADEQIQFDLPFDQLHLVSEDFPIIASFQYARVSSPVLVFSLNTNKFAGALEDYVTQEDHKFTFSSNGVTGSFASESSSPASTNVVNVSLLCVGILSLVCFQQHRKTSIFLFVLFAMYYAYAVTVYHEYHVVIQIPVGSPSPFRALQIESSGGSFESIVAFSDLREIDIDLCGAGESHIFMEEFDASQTVQMCADSIQLRGVFSGELTGSLRSDNLIIFMENRYSGTLTIQSDTSVVMGADYCQQSNDVYSCGGDSGVLILDSRDIIIEIIRPSATPSNTSSPEPSFDAPSRPPVPSASASNQANPSASASPGIPSIPIGASPSPSALPSIPIDASASSAVDPSASASSAANPSVSASSASNPSASASSAANPSASASSAASPSATPSSAPPDPDHFPISASGEFLQMVRLDIVRPTNGENPVVARSYNGNPWEAKPDNDFPPVTFDCSFGTECALLTSGVYEVQVVDIPSYLLNPSLEALWSRFMLQSTFGVTKDELDSLVQTYGANYEDWVSDQINSVPATLHRPYFRARTNPRRLSNTDEASLFKPCEIGSRYQRNAFNQVDEGKTLTISNSEVAGKLTLRVETQLRTEVDDFLGINATSPVTFPIEYTICLVSDIVNGTIHLDNGTSLCSIQYLNPIISFSSLDSSFMKDIPLASATFVPVRNMPDAMVLQEISTTCDELPSINAFIRYDSQYYRFDARLKLLRNSLAEPVQVDLSEISSTCPSVRRNFLNEEFCIPSHTCSPVTFDGTPVLLEEDNLRAWYLDDRLYVYEIRDLRLESPYDISACTGRSRWKRLGVGNCPSLTTFADPQTMDTFVDALTNSNDPNPYVRDIILQGTNCTDDGSTIGAQVEADGECFEHVHPDLHSVYDFTLWTIFHDGNEPAAEAGKPNPIAKWAEEGNTYLQFPSWHSVNNWAIRQEYFSFVGRRGDSIPFNSLQTDLQTMSMAERVGAIAVGTEDGVEACGSPNEFENQPELGDKYHFSDNIPAADRNHWIDTTDYSSRNAKQKVWLNAILSGNDHLRQRVAWAISQIIPVSEEDLGNPERTESWTNYYDIFVRNAFGNYRDILREVSFNHLMSRYLSFYRNRGFSNSGTYPDENYAREIMQLFSVGLWKLNEDGTIALDGEGNPIATYSNDDILDFARLWTGFDVELYRGNTEPYGTDNGIDPQQVKVDWRDYLPKAKLDAGYLGDAYPLCNELPQHHWLKPGAHFRLTGSASEEGETMDKEEPDEAGYVGRFAPPPTSELYQALCAPSGGECTFPPEVVLDRTLACDNSSIECQVQVVTTIKIYDQTANVTKYYTYTSVPCVKLSFFDNGQLTAYNRDRLQCAPPKQPVAVPICCTANRPNNPVNNISNQTCLVTKELMDYQTAVNRCADAGYSICNTTWGASWTSSCQSAAFQWVNQTCNLQVQIFPSGRISIVDPLSADNEHPTFAILRENGTNLFRVRWDNNEFPQANNNCIPGCRRVTTLLGDTCVCDITVSDTVAFTDVNTLPDKDQVLSQLFQGSVEPMLYDDRSYTLCSQCSQPGYQVWTTTPDVLDENSIFEITPSLAGGKTLYLFNRESIVSVGSHSFRNPPRFLVGAGDIQYYWTEWNPISLKTPAAKWEVEALLDHLFEHESTGPFIAYRLIQRLVTSNPSPRYMKTVVDAFRTGTYNGEVFSGKYGDLAATITAIVLDREARTPMLEADPTFGVIKEPLVRVVQVLSSLDFRTINGDEFTISRNLVDIIGMEAYRSPSVFGFYLPENRPEGPLNDLGMVSPEAQLTITPNLFGLLNGFMSLVEYGYSRCSFADSNRWCGTRPDTDQIQALANYMPNNLTDVQQVIDELDLLFTGQRLNPSFKQHIINQYTATMMSDSPEAAFTLAQKLILLSPEFHVTSAHQESEQVREPTEDVPSQGRPYKAIVVLIEDGGVDSYNLIVPHSNCVGKDYYAEYNLVREGAAIALGELLPISVPSGTQPCDTFGVHPGFPNLKNSYDNGEALFIANMGALVEPITKDDYFARPVVKDLPPSLFAHNIMSRSTQNLHPQNTAAAGVLGRAVESLRNQSIPYSSELYSLIGATKILDGGDPEYITTGGVIQFNDYAELIGDINNMTASVSESPMAETYLSLLTNSLNSTEELGTLLDGVTLNQTFPTSYIGRQMQQVAKFITLRDQLNTERDVFVVRSGGFDTHATFDLGSLFTPIDDALETFKQEMISENIWDSVTVVAISEFGRTLTSNGAGTDHGWGGNYFVLGGSVDGGKILGEYPDTLTEEGDVHIGRGRLLPTTSWEAIWGGLLQWFGVEQAAIEEVLPNLSNFLPSDLFSQSDLFQ